MSSNSRKKGNARPRSKDWSMPTAPAAGNPGRAAIAKARRGGLLALGLLIAAAALYAALISYDSADRGVLLRSDSVVNSRTVNLLGPAGAFVASALLFALGAAAWAVPMVLVWLALTWLLSGRPLPRRSWFGGGLLLVVSACLVAIQPWFLIDWETRWNIPGRGGAIGWLLGGSGAGAVEANRLIGLMQRFLGLPASLLLCLLAYATALFLLSGVPLRRLLRAAGGMPAAMRARSRQRRSRSLERTLSRAVGTDDSATVSAIKRSARRFTRGGSPQVDAEAAAVGRGPDPEPAQAARRLFGRRGAAAKSGGKDAEEPPGVPARTGSRSERPATTAPATQAAPPASAGNSARRKAPVHLDFPGYTVPASTLISAPPPDARPNDEGELLAIHDLLVETLGSFGVEVTPGDITRGPTVSRFEVYPARGLRVSRIAAFDADLARATKAERVNILAPIPGKDTVGIEIANRNRILVTLRELVEDREFSDKRKRIPIALGKDVYGRAVVGDLAAMPHLLVAGATGSGKSVCINAIISSILFRFTPDELRFLLIDPKVVEMQLYNKLPHLLFPVITEPKKVVLALRWVVNEMERRYRLLARVSVRNIDGFNRRDRSRDPAGPAPEEEELDEDGLEHIERIARAMDGEDDEPPPTAASELDLFADPNEPIPHSLPYIVVIIDELADLMQQARPEVEGAIQRITQKARAAGIHLIVATQTPRAEVITGTIKANIPSRIAFAVSNKIDSRVILDAGGAEKLVGKGDSLYLDPRSGELVRTQGCFVEDEEVEDLVRHCFDQAKPRFTTRLEEAVAVQQQDPAIPDDIGQGDDRDDDMLQRCIEVIKAEGAASTSLLQRRLSLGYTRAARMMDLLEQRGIISPPDGAKRRTVLVKAE